MKEAKKARDMERGLGTYTILDDKRVENFKKEES